MRKQIIAMMVGAVALLFSIVAITAGPALGDNYASYPALKGELGVTIVDPVPCGGPISGAVSGGTAPYTVTVSVGNGVLSTTLAASGAYAFPIDASIVPAGTTTYTYSVVDAAGASAGGSVTANISYTCTVVTPGPTVIVQPTVIVNPTPGPAVDFGFGNNGVPNQPALAITGADTDILGFIATALIAAGAIAMGSRRKFLQGALES